MHSVTINISAPAALVDSHSRTPARKWLLGRARPAAERKGVGWRGRAVCRADGGVSWWFWDVETIWRTPRDEDTRRFSHECNLRSVLPTFAPASCSTGAAASTAWTNIYVTQTQMRSPAQKTGAGKRRSWDWKCL